MRQVADAALPGLSAALDVDGFLDLLRERLPECREDLEIEAGRIDDVQYTPGQKGLVLYRLKLRGRSGGRSRRQLVFARAVRQGESPVLSRERLARYAALPDRVLRTPYLGLPQLGLDVHAFPMDPVLTQLADAFDPVFMKRALSEFWAERGLQVRRVTAHPLGYTPQARIAIRYEVLSKDRQTGAPEVRHLVGKIHATRPASALFARSWAIWRASKLRVRLAAPVGFLPSLNMTLQEWVAGERLGDLAGTATFVRPVRDAARSIAVVHGLSVPLRSQRPARRELRVVQRWGSVLAALRPEHAARIERLRDGLASELEARIRLSGPVHGDFHPANLLVRDGRATIIDLDQLAFGDPLIDVGRFLSSLRVSALRVSGDPSALQSAGDAFLARYLAQTHDDERRLRLFEAACLLTAAATGFRLQRPGWEEHAARLFDEAERVFALAGTGERTGVTVPHAKDPPLPEDRGFWATDPLFLRATLEPPVREEYGAELRSVRGKLRGDAGAGLRVRLRLRGRCDGRPWSVSLRASDAPPRSRRRFERLRALHGALDGRPHAPLVPRPVAWLPELGVEVVERPRGTRFDALLATARGPESAEALAQALATLHVTPLVLRRSRPLDEELDRVRGSVEALGEALPALRERASALLEHVAARVGAADPGLGPVLRRLPLRRVLSSDGGRIAFRKLEDVRLSHPLLDVGALRAQIGLWGVSSGSQDRGDVAAAHLEDAYAAAAGVPGEDVRAFGALALLRAACSRGGRGDPEALVARLLELAERAAAR